MAQPKNQNGFTIVELLVVLVIIGLIAALATALFSDARARSRDARRAEDMKTIQSALSIYSNQNGVYPLCATEDSVSGCLASHVWTGIISAIPNDPRLSGSGLCSGGANDLFRYCYWSDGTNYTLWYHLETDSVPHLDAGWHQINP